MKDLKKRTMNSAFSSLNQAISMISDDNNAKADYNLDIQTMRNSAQQAMQAATDLTIMVGIVIAEDTIRRETMTMQKKE